MAAQIVISDQDTQITEPERRQAERARIGCRAAANEAAFHSALLVLANPLQPASASSTPLFQACEAVARASGITLKRPGTSSQDALTVQTIAQASGVRVRRVRLRGAWWKRDAGPLLAWCGGRPIALLPLEKGRYQAYDPSAAAPGLVDVEVAAEIDDGAYIFYGALPAGDIGIAGLLSYALCGSAGDLFRVLAYSGAAGLLGLAAPLLTASIVGDAIPAGDRAQILVFACGLAVSAICSALFNLGSTLAVQRTSARAAGIAMSAMWMRVLALPIWFFRRFNPAELALRVFSIDRAREALAGGVVTGAVACFFSLFHVFLLFRFAPSLTLPALALAGVIAAVSGLCGRLLLRYHLAAAECGAATAGRTLELVQGVAKLRLAGAEQRAFASWAHLFAQGRREAFRARRISVVVSAVQSAAPLAGWTLIAAFAASDASLRRYPANLLAFSVSFQQLLSAALEVSSLFLRWSEISALASCARPLLAEAVEANPAGIDPGQPSGAIEVRDLSFRYEPAGAEVLRGISFRIEPGEFVAFVGSSGGGKSTLLRLLLGFDRAERGSISYDGRELASLDLELLRRQLGVVLQNGCLLGGTIASNILGASGLGLEEAWRAAETASIADEIRAMPMGMHTPVSESGAGFSGGQRQRILIARALVNSPRILLLDEATSALDNRTQAAVAAGLQQLGLTRIVIAHRLSTIRHADRIFVLESGRIVESGDYEELCARGERFRELARFNLL
jgi:NHLM bacteriocin system ABC transporter ATP-binding protein